MRNIVSAYVERFLHDRRERLKFGGIVLLLAVIVVGIVFWRLSYVGVAMTNEVYCGMEEHQHDSSCYTEVLTCGLEESAGSEGHTHDASCYETVTELVCGLEESEGHTHDDSCFDEDGNLICAIPESEGHTHTDACYETTQVLICGLEEEPATEGHTHDSSCYELVLTCDIPEHTHSIECMMDETADVETYKDWEDTLPDGDDLTGVWTEDLVLIAQSQIGYIESTANFQLAEDGETRQGYTRYGAWYGNEYGGWDAMFVSFCLNYAGVSEEEFPFFPYNSGAYAWTVELEQEGLYVDAEDHEPTPGDLIFLNTDDDKKADTVAVVTEVNEKTGKLTLIQGDSNDAVEEYKIDLDDASIVGFGILPDQPEEMEEILPAEQIPDGDEGYEEELEEEEIDEAKASEEIIDLAEEAEEEEVVKYAAENGGVLVTVSAPADALPEDAELSMTLYEEESQEYAQAAEAIGLDDIAALSAPTEDGEDETEIGMIALDICFMTDGDEVEPAEPVTVTIDASALVPEDAGEITVTHLAETEDGLEPEVVAVVNGDEAVAEFEVESFSNFTITWETEGSATEVTVYIYDINGLGIWDSDEQGDGEAYVWETGAHTIADLLEEHVAGKISDSYTYAYATVQYLTTSAMGGSVTTIGSADNPVVSVSWDGSSYTVTTSSSAATTVAGSDAGEFYINLYFSTPTVTISMTGSSAENHTVSLTADAEYFQNGGENGEGITYTWEIIDFYDADEDAEEGAGSSGVASITGDGSAATLTWEDNDKAGDRVTVQVTATTTTEDDKGNTIVETAVDTFELTYGMQQVTYTVYYGTTGTSGTIASGAHVALLDGNGNVVSSGETDENGKVTLWVVPGTSYTLEASYTASSGSGQQAAYIHYSYESKDYVYTESGPNVTDIYMTVSDANYYEHVDIKISIGTEESQDYGDILSNVDCVKIYDETGELVYQSTQLVHNEGTNDYNVLFADANGNVGTNPHSIAFYDTYTVEIAYEISYTWTTTENGEEVSHEYTETYVARIDSRTTYADGEYYPYDGTNAYQLYNELNGTGYTAETFAAAVAASQSAYDSAYGSAIASGQSVEEAMAAALAAARGADGGLSGYTPYGISVAGETYFKVAAALCDTKDTTDQAGLDFALGVKSLNQNTSAGWTFDIQKTLNGKDMTNGEFTFVLFSAATENADDGSIIWSEGSAVAGSPYTNGAADMDDEDKSSVDLIETVPYSVDLSSVGEPVSFYYIMYEEQGREEGIVYDNTVYGIEVTVTWNSAEDVNDVTVKETAYKLEAVINGDDESIMYVQGAELSELESTDNGVTIYPFVNYYDEGPFGFDIYKYTGEKGSEVGLAGAEFTLSMIETDEGTGEGSVSEAYFSVNTVSNEGREESTKKTVYTFEGWNLSDRQQAGYTDTLASGEDGFIHVEGLPAGTYILTEVSAPDGYNLLSESIAFTVNSDGTVTINDGGGISLTNDSAIAVENLTASELPKTGGMGTVLFTIAGLMLAAGAGMTLTVRSSRRKRG